MIHRDEQRRVPLAGLRRICARKSVPARTLGRRLPTRSAQETGETDVLAPGAAGLARLVTLHGDLVLRLEASIGRSEFRDYVRHLLVDLFLLLGRGDHVEGAPCESGDATGV